MRPEDALCGPNADPTLFARISELVATSESLDEILKYIIEEAVIACNADRGFLAIADHDRGELDVRYTAGSGWTEETRIDRLKVSEETGRGITSHVAATAMPYMSPNVLEDPYYRMYFEDVRSELAVPLVDGHKRTLGVINIESTQLNAFGEGHECTVVGLAHLGTIALTVSELRAREAAIVQIGKELNALPEMNMILQKVVEVAAEALKFEDCSLFLLDRASGKLVLRASRGVLGKRVGEASYEVGEGLTGWTGEQQLPVRLQNPLNDPRWRGRFEEMPAKEIGAFMAVPINSPSGIMGVLRVQRRKSPYKWFPNDFTEEDERVLATIAVQLGIALDNARLLDQLVRTERMAAWGEMSARSAHMIGNRVFAIKGDVNEMEYLLGSSNLNIAEAMQLSESIKKGIFLLEEILNEFREFVKATQLDTEDVDINELVKQSVDEGFPKRSQTHVKFRLGKNLPSIQADSKKLMRCFCELMENSVNFMPDGGEIKVCTCIAEPSSRKWLRPGQQSGKYIQVKFEDKGPGVDSELKPKIFDPFYTSRAKGMGLGLSIVKGIVEAHNGVIFESGKPGKGAKFTILLPYDEPIRELTGK
ncbi:MAG: GAF domain-containing protein [Armatimonadota bacterium]|nr:GAF domain-containing protein [bacterium]